MIVLAGLAFALAAATGAITRVTLRARLGTLAHLPVGTLAANVAGSFALGVVAAFDGPLATILAIGLIGSLTTMSTFAFELLDMIDRKPARAAIYATLTLAPAIGLAWLGLILGESLAG